MALTLVKTDGKVVNIPVSEFRAAELAEQLDHQTEALSLKNNDIFGVFMTAAHRNALTDRLEAAMLMIDMLRAGRTWDDVKRSAEESAQGKVTSGADLLAQLRARAADA